MTKAELISRIESLAWDANYRVNESVRIGYKMALGNVLQWANTQPDEAPEAGQVVQSGNITILPSPVQQEPSALEVALRMMAMDSGLHWEAAVADAWAMVDLSRAEEARRAGK